MKRLEFFFDFSSPYSYVASESIESIASKYDRTVDFTPILLGAVFKVTGGRPLTDLHASKSGYSARDFARSARFFGVPFKMPTVFPLATVTAARAMVWLQAQRSDKAASFMHAVFRAFFAEDRNISELAVVANVAAQVGIDATALAAGVQEQSVKDRLKAHVDEAIARGVFGAPTIFVDGEMFWGNDRLAQVERWLERGPF